MSARERARSRRSDIAFEILLMATAISLWSLFFWAVMGR